MSNMFLPIDKKEIREKGCYGCPARNWSDGTCQALKRNVVDVNYGECPDWCPLENDTSAYIGNENPDDIWYKWVLKMNLLIVINERMKEIGKGAEQKSEYNTLLWMGDEIEKMEGFTFGSLTSYECENESICPFFKKESNNNE